MDRMILLHETEAVTRSRMRKEGLTAKQVEHAKPTGRRYEMPARPPGGLYLVVHPTGAKGWALRYRWAGKTRNLTFKQGYPEMSLATARAEAERKLSDLKNGIDPAVSHEIEVRQAEPNSAESVAKEWLERTMRKKASHGEVKRILHREVLPEWKHKLIGDIGRPDILRLLDKTVDRGAPVLANRMFTILKRWFKWSVMRGYIEHSPAAMIERPADEESRDRVLSENELRAISEAVPDLGYPFGDYFRFLLLTGQRRGEVAAMKWEQVDLEQGVWTLPRKSTKSRRIHDVPLSGPALNLLTKIPRFKEGSFVFTTTSGKRPISGFSKGKLALDAAILRRRTDAAKLTGERDVKPIAEWHLHDMRRTLTTWMADNRVAPHVLAAILNHTPGSTMGITAVYARSKWATEKREALAAWADYLYSLDKKPAVKAATA